MDITQALELVYVALEAGIGKIQVEGLNRRISGVMFDSGTIVIKIRKIPPHGNE